MEGWTLFLDRDGVINELLPGRYVQTIDEFVFVPTIFEALKKASAYFGRIVVVTNQQGIGKQLMTADDLHEIHSFCKMKIEAEGGRIDAFFYAPALESENSPLRKPNTGMPLLAQEMFPEINFEKSIIVGDSLSDIEMGKKLGMKTVFISKNVTNHNWADYCSRDVLSWINTII